MTEAPHCDRQLMQRAIDAAHNCASEAGEISPRVGAVASREGRVMASAYRGELSAGEHAEFTLLERKLSWQDLRDVAALHNARALHGAATNPRLA